MEKERTLHVMARASHTDLLEWLQMVVEPALAYDHKSNALGCTAETMEWLKIPMESDLVGTAPVRQ